jgi:GT2 family glycosyltransferase
VLTNLIQLNKKFGIVVVVYGSGAQKVLKNYATIYEKLSASGFSVVIVDHGGHDYQDKEFMRPNIIHLKQENKGFGSGVNLGCRRLLESCEYAFVFNPDLDFSVEEFIQIGEKIIKPFYVIEVLEFGKRSSIFYYNQLTGAINDVPSRWGVPYFNGAAFCISRQLFELTGGFDENYFLYFEDIDFSFQLQDCSIPLEVMPTLTFIHEVGGSRIKGMDAFIQKVAAQSALRLVRKWFRFNVWLYARYLLKWALSSVRNPAPGQSKVKIDI